MVPQGTPQELPYRVEDTPPGSLLVPITGKHSNSGHSYMHDNWDTVQNTIDFNNPDEQGGQNKEGAKIYVGWGKHAMFAQRNTGWNDEASQGCGREFRSRDWWYGSLMFAVNFGVCSKSLSRYIPSKSDLINSAPGTSAANAMSALDWGSADSGPWVVAPKVCDAKEGGFTAC